ncbi:MAG: hypothetical protein WCS03_18930 [Bacteroidota bacterium]
MAKLTFEGLTAKQAKILSEWFEGQGEQDCNVWFECNDEIAPLTDVQRKGGWRKIDKNGDVTVFCKTPE